MPTHSIVSGIQDMGGMGRINSNSGRTSLLIGSYQAISHPSGTPMPMPRNSPVSETFRLMAMFFGRVDPSGLGFVNLSNSVPKTTDGAGIMPVEPVTASSYHRIRKAATVAIERKVYFSFLS